MPKYNRSELDVTARKYGFLRDTFEKVLRLKEILSYFNNEEFLKEHILLKGGTAINLMLFSLPRLSWISIWTSPPTYPERICLLPENRSARL